MWDSPTFANCREVRVNHLLHFFFQGLECHLMQNNSPISRRDSLQVVFPSRVRKTLQNEEGGKPHAEILLRRMPA